jgi:hypothetical protein
VDTADLLLLLLGFLLGHGLTPSQWCSSPPAASYGW